MNAERCQVESLRRRGFDTAAARSIGGVVLFTCPAAFTLMIAAIVTSKSGWWFYAVCAVVFCWIWLRTLRTELACARIFANLEGFYEGIEAARAGEDGEEDEDEEDYAEKLQ